MFWQLHPTPSMPLAKLKDQVETELEPRGTARGRADNHSHLSLFTGLHLLIRSKKSTVMFSLGFVVFKQDKLVKVFL